LDVVKSLSIKSIAESAVVALGLEILVLLTSPLLTRIISAEAQKGKRARREIESSLRRFKLQLPPPAQTGSSPHSNSGRTYLMARYDFFTYHHQSLSRFVKNNPKGFIHNFLPWKLIILLLYYEGSKLLHFSLFLFSLQPSNKGF